MILVIAICIAIFAIYLQIEKKGQKPTSKPTPKPVNTYYNSTEYVQILRLVNSDKATANRLILYTQKRNPNRNSEWVLEKVLYDLKRDRA